MDVNWLTLSHYEDQLTFYIQTNNHRLLACNEYKKNIAKIVTDTYGMTHMSFKYLLQQSKHKSYNTDLQSKYSLP